MPGHLNTQQRRRWRKHRKQRKSVAFPRFQCDNALVARQAAAKGDEAAAETRPRSRENITGGRADLAPRNCSEINALIERAASCRATTLAALDVTPTAGERLSARMAATMCARWVIAAWPTGATDLIVPTVHGGRALADPA
jgi:hypothetical protein